MPKPHFAASTARARAETRGNPDNPEGFSGHSDNTHAHWPCRSMPGMMRHSAIWTDDMFTILDRYLMTEIIKTLFSILFVLLMIVAVHNFIIILERGVAGTIATDVIFSMLALELTKELGLLIAPTFFFAVLMTMGRMYRDSEMTALFAGGVGLLRIFRGYAWVIVPVMLFSALMMMVAKPWAHRLLEGYKKQQNASAEVSRIGAGKFNESGSGDLVFYVEELTDDHTLMRNLFVQHRKGKDLGVVRSRQGYQYTDPQSGDSYIVMQDGFRYDGEPGRLDYRISRFDNYAVRIGQGEVQSVHMEPKLRSMAELIASDQLADKAELQFRLSAPLAVLVFAVLSIPLSRASPRQGMAGRMVLALVTYFIFSNLQALSGSWMLNGVTPVWMGRWWVHLLMLLLAILLNLLDSFWFSTWLKNLRDRLVTTRP
jgi:lipopolysaccharide export system permease protein